MMVCAIIMGGKETQIDGYISPNLSAVAVPAFEQGWTNRQRIFSNYPDPAKPYLSLIAEPSLIYKDGKIWAFGGTLVHSRYRIDLQSPIDINGLREYGAGIDPIPGFIPAPENIVAHWGPYNSTETDPGYDVGGYTYTAGACGDPDADISFCCSHISPCTQQHDGQMVLTPGALQCVRDLFAHRCAPYMTAATAPADPISGQMGSLTSITSGYGPNGDAVIVRDRWFSWDAGSIETPAVITDSAKNSQLGVSGSGPDNTIFRMWFAGAPATSDDRERFHNYQIGYAESGDGIHWTKYQSPTLAIADPVKYGLSAPVFSPSKDAQAFDTFMVADPYVLKVGVPGTPNAYIMYYTGGSEWTLTSMLHMKAMKWENTLSPGCWYNYRDLVQPNYVTTADDYLEYDVLIPASANEPVGGIEMEFFGAGGLGQDNSAVVDQNGINVDPSTRLGCSSGENGCTLSNPSDKLGCQVGRPCAVGQWYHRKIAIPANRQNLRVTAIEMALSICGIGNTNEVFFQNIKITNGEATKLSIYSTEPIFNFPAETVSPSNYGFTSVTTEIYHSRVYLTAIMFATSSDGIHWSRYPTPILAGDPGAMAVRPRVRRLNGMFEMWYYENKIGSLAKDEFTGIFYAGSTDGVTWVKHGRVTDKSPRVETTGLYADQWRSNWDIADAQGQDLITLGGKDYLIYVGSDCPKAELATLVDRYGNVTPGYPKECAPGALWNTSWGKLEKPTGISSRLVPYTGSFGCGYPFIYAVVNVNEPVYRTCLIPSTGATVGTLAPCFSPTQQYVGNLPVQSCNAFTVILAQP